MVPDIWSATDITFCHFGQNFKKVKKPPGDIIALHMCNINENHMTMVPEMWSMWQTEFFVILDHFFPFYHPNNPENQNFEKYEKTTGDITILHMCTIIDNHMRYGS